MPARFHVPIPLGLHDDLTLPPGPARHVQVLRLQPGSPLTLFDGGGGEWRAEVLRMGRSEVAVRVVAHEDVDRELARPVTLAVGMPANDRMDWLVEKATELGAAAVQPLVCERSVLRLSGERAERKLAHWQAVAVAAAEQCGRTRVPAMAPVRTLREWLALAPASGATGCLLSLEADARPLAQVAGGPQPDGPGPLVCLSGPEGGLAPAEVDAARAAGFVPVTLGPRVLRAETAPLAVLAWVGGAVAAG